MGVRTPLPSEKIPPREGSGVGLGLGLGSGGAFLRGDFS